QGTGEIGISLASMTPIGSAAGGSLVTIALHEKSTAIPEATAIALVASVSPNGRVFSTVVYDNQGPFLLTPTPTNSGTAPGLQGNVLLPGGNVPSLTPISVSSENSSIAPRTTATSAAIS